MSWARAAWVVLSKEVREGFRDRRTVLTALVFPALGPVMLAATLALALRPVRTAEERGVTLAVAGQENAPHLVEFLRQGAEVREAPPDAEGAVRRGELEVVVVIPREFGERLRSGRPAPVRLVVDESRQQARPTAIAAERLLAAWSRVTSAQRLVVRGIHPAVADPLAVEKVDVSTPESRAAVLLSAVPFFLVLAIFTGGLSTAIDATAGERERQSLEPLLATPVPRPALAVGKIGATCFLSVIALAETLALFGLVPLVLPPARIGLSVRLDPWVLVRTFGLGVPLILLSGALMVVLAARARTFRAAQTTLSLLTLVPAMPGLVMTWLSPRPLPWLLAVPYVGEQLIVSRLIRGEYVPFSDGAISTVATLAAAALVTWLAVRTFERGQALFGS
jgi:sodium transport system permease protein